MNLFFRELWFYKKSLFFWCLGMVALVGSGMSEYALFKDDSAALVELMAQFPRSVQAVFGLTGFDLTIASEYFGFLFMYIALMATVHSVLLGAGIVSKEERDKTSEFLFVKPISRFRVLSVKISVGLFNIVVLNLITLMTSIYFVGYFAGDKPFIGSVLILIMGLLFLQIIFFFVGTTVAGISKKPKLSASIATSILLLTFVMTFFININENFSWLGYLTPFKYFEAKNLILNNSFDPVHLVISSFLIVSMFVVTYRSYGARDLNI